MSAKVKRKILEIIDKTEILLKVALNTHNPSS
jgi:hypothetical protein